jgi:hypothetical protein
MLWISQTPEKRHRVVTPLFVPKLTRRNAHFLCVTHVSSSTSSSQNRHSRCVQRRRIRDDTSIENTDEAIDSGSPYSHSLFNPVTPDVINRSVKDQVQVNADGREGQAFITFVVGVRRIGAYIYGFARQRWA